MVNASAPAMPTMANRTIGTARLHFIQLRQPKRSLMNMNKYAIRGYIGSM